MTRWNDLAAVLLDSLGDRVADRGRPAWVQIHDDPAGGQEFDLIVADDMEVVGWHAPPECQALAVVATGTVERADPGLEPPVPIPVGRTPGARLSCVAARDGETGWALRLPDGTVLDRAPEGGRLLDCLRRAVGLPTAPPPSSPGPFQSALWLSAIIDEGALRDRQLSWREVIRLHPVASAIEEGGGPQIAARDLPELVRAASHAWTWSRLRLDAVIYGWAKAVIPCDVAEWMDDGMFCRWLLAELPGNEELIKRIRPYVAPATARRIAHAVRAAA